MSSVLESKEDIVNQSNAVNHLTASAHLAALLKLKAFRAHEWVL